MHVRPLASRLPRSCAPLARASMERAEAGKRLRGLCGSCPAAVGGCASAVRARAARLPQNLTRRKELGVPLNKLTTRSADVLPLLQLFSPRD